MLARQRLERGRAPFHVFLARRVDVQGLEITSQGLGRFPQGNRRFRQHLSGRRQRRIGFASGAQCGLSLGDQAVRIEAFRFVNGGERRSCGLGEPAAIGDAPAFDEQFLDGRHRRDLGGEFGDLVAQQIQPGVAVRHRGTEIIQFTPAGAMFCVQSVDGRHQGGVGQMSVQEFALDAALHEVLEFLLAMDLDHELRKISQRL